MAYKTIVTYESDGVQTVFSFPFDYLRKAFIKVRTGHIVDGLEELEQGVEFSVMSKQVTLVTPAAIGEVVEISRVTATDKIVTWIDGSVLRANDMNTFETQVLHLEEETADKLSNDIALFAQQAEAAADIAVENKNTVVTKAGEVQASAAAAASSASAAHTSEVNASASATGAANSAATATTKASQAATSETNAANSASTATTKASEGVTSASNAASSATNAANSAASAAISATNAANSATEAAASAVIAENAAITAAGMSDWTVASRPSSPNTGRVGYNTDLAVIERWNGSAWRRISGGNQGDTKHWWGTYANAEASNPGWKLFNGQTFIHPESGASVTLPDLRDRFLVAAGLSYANGATGGADTVTLTIAQTPNHVHSVDVYSGAAGDVRIAQGLSVGGVKGTISTSGTGGGGSHENRPPYAGACLLYKL